MFEHENIITQPVFFLFIAFSFLLSFGYFWGRRQNKKLFLSAFNDLADVVKPDDQTFTNIGGVIGYHAKFFIRKKGAFLSRVDATITMLPRHSWLYFPISKIISKYDRLFITLYLKQNPSGEGHLIEKKYAAFRGPKITNEQRLNKETINWGNYDFLLYYENTRIRDHFIKFMKLNPEPATIKHIAIIPDQKKSFVFMIPHKKKVAQDFAPIYQWLPSVIKQQGIEKK